ncbi:pectinesterase family protein [Flavobacterium seoulense]|nr:pectinesterase family protein [Flavobacterium seoulense]
MKVSFYIVFLVSILFKSLSPVYANNVLNKITVALDGSGDYKSIQEAITACGAFPADQKTIFIKNGIYKEKVLIDSFHSNISLVGESTEKTIITYDNYAGQAGIGTFTSYTLKVLGNNIKIENLTIENSSGRVGQAVALHVEGDYFIANNCKVLGNQDTLYAAGENSRQYYTDCLIEGTTDFIFGSATAIFSKCNIHSKANSYITAANTAKETQFGYVFFKCTLTADPNIDKVYLGRPWREFANVAFINCFLGKHIRSEGWHNWDKPEREKTAFFAEYGNYGPGSETGKRVKWFQLLSKSKLKEFTVKNIFKVQNQWLLDSANL